ERLAKAILWIALPHLEHFSPSRPYTFSDREKYPLSPLTFLYCSSKDVPPDFMADFITLMAEVITFLISISDKSSQTTSG
ncbi:MAG: hypothetical protein RIS16_790, partial [Actinomycetota bacterium]